MDCRQAGSERTPEKMTSGQSAGGLDTPMSWLKEELLPEITLLDVTCDSPLPGSMPATPATAGSMKHRFTSLQLSRLSSSSTNLNATAEIPWPQKKTLDLLKSNVSSLKAESETFNAQPSKQNDMNTSSGTSSRDSTENTFEVHSLEHNGTANTDTNDKMVDPPESVYAPVRWLDVRYFPEITLLEVTRESELSHDGELSSTEGVQGSVLETSTPASEPSGPNVVKTQTSAEVTFTTHPANVTNDLSCSSDMSVKCAASQFSTPDKQSDSKNVTSEIHGEPVATCNTEETNNEEMPVSHDAELTSKEPQSSPTTSGAVNSMLTSLQQSQLSSSTDLNTTAQTPCPRNQTLDLPLSDVNTPRGEGEATDQATPVCKITMETSSVMNPNCSAVKGSGPCEMQNGTFDRHSLHKLSANPILGDGGGAATFCLQNNTFDAKPPKQNGTITLSETSSSDTSRQNTFDKPSPLKDCNATSTPKEDKEAEVQPPELLNDNGSTDCTNQNVKMVVTSESIINPAVEEASGVGLGETKDCSQSAPALTDGISDTLGDQNMDMDMEGNKASNVFNLDDTLDLRADTLITSTPMTNCKIFYFNTQRDEGKTQVAQKRLYGDVPSKPDAQASSDVPSNIACDRKTFFAHPAAKSLLPASRAASQLLRHKPASRLPGKFEAWTSGLPMTRQRTQAEALRNAAALEAPQTTGISSSYKLRATTRGSKQPNSSLQKPQLSGIPSGIQRTAKGLRPPSARGNPPASSNTNRLRGPTAVSNPATKTSQAKKPPLTRGEALPIAKRMKMDTPLPTGSTDVVMSSCDAANGAKNLKQPTTSKRVLPTKTQRDDAAVPASTSAEISTSCDAVSRARALKQPATSHRSLQSKAKGHGCANCILLEQQLKMQSEEIRRLREAAGEK